MKRLWAFSWGYWGWGNHTGEFIDRPMRSSEPAANGLLFGRVADSVRDLQAVDEELMPRLSSILRSSRNNVRYGSLADTKARIREVRFNP